MSGWHGGIGGISCRSRKHVSSQLAYWSAPRAEQGRTDQKELTHENKSQAEIASHHREGSLRPASPLFSFFSCLLSFLPLLQSSFEGLISARPLEMLPETEVVAPLPRSHPHLAMSTVHSSTIRSNIGSRRKNLCQQIVDRHGETNVAEQSDE